MFCIRYCSYILLWVICIRSLKSAFAATTPFLKNKAATSITSNAGALVNTVAGKMIESDNSLDMIAATKKCKKNISNIKRKQIKTLLHF